jgi:hypothetical protein
MKDEMEINLPLKLKSRIGKIPSALDGQGFDAIEWRRVSWQGKR